MVGVWLEVGCWIDLEDSNDLSLGEKKFIFLKFGFGGWLMGG